MNTRVASQTRRHYHSYFRHKTWCFAFWIQPSSLAEGVQAFAVRRSIRCTAAQPTFLNVFPQVVSLFLPERLKFQNLTSGSLKCCHVMFHLFSNCCNMIQWSTAGSYILTAKFDKFIKLLLKLTAHNTLQNSKQNVVTKLVSNECLFSQPTLCQNSEMHYTLPQVNNRWITTSFWRLGSFQFITFSIQVL